LLAAGLVAEVRDLLLNFGRFEHHGTLPNTIHGEDASNRDTSDAPLWYGVACEELAAWECSVPGIAGVPPAPVGVPTDGLPSASNASAKIYATSIDPANRTIADVLRSIVVGYLRGTPNGIRVDPESGLVWSPSHFTWMDTNHPAGTPREGYPVEIQALWIRLLRQLDRIQAVPEGEPWAVLARRAEQSVQTLYWLEGGGYFADVLLTKPGVPARSAVPDQALRSNHLLLLSLGLVNGERARRCVAAAQQHLMVPGALRSLAPLPVTPPLPIYGRESRLLNNPNEPYWGRYEGDEDSRRKPAYHNGTAWLWTFPHFCEALVRAWDFSPPAVAAARAYLGSLDRLMNEGCLGQLPEIVDGDAPHQPRGCDAQAWSATEALRVWDWLRKLGDRK
jgi:glycogen debranching enzyme